MGRPEGVKIVRPDGDDIDCDDKLQYQGMDDQGLDQWHIEGVDFRPGVDKLTCAVLPGKTSLGILAPGALLPPNFSFGVDFDKTDMPKSDIDLEDQRQQRTIASLKRWMVVWWVLLAIYIPATCILLGLRDISSAAIFVILAIFSVGMLVWNRRKIRQLRHGDV